MTQIRAGHRQILMDSSKKNLLDTMAKEQWITWFHFPESLFTVDDVAYFSDEDIAWKMFYSKEKKEYDKTVLSTREREQIFFEDGSVTPMMAFLARKNYIISQYEDATRLYYEKKAKGVDTTEVEKLKNALQKRYEMYVNNCGITEEDVDVARKSKMSEQIHVDSRGYANCPFHIEKTPSFHVKDNKWYCFGCSGGGDTIAFIQKRDGVGFLQAIRLLCKK